jgi:hypothetical protein
MHKIILTAILAAATTMAGVIQNTISVTAGTTNAVTDYFDIGDRDQTVRQIDSIEFYVINPATNITALVYLRQEMYSMALTNTVLAYTVAGTGATNAYPRRTTNSKVIVSGTTNVVQQVEPYAVNRAFLFYSFALATNSTQAVGCTNGVSIAYKILTR